MIGFYFRSCTTISLHSSLISSGPVLIICVSAFQGKSHRDQQLLLLKKHLENNYRSRDRKWIVLFPEGGFLRKRRETSQAFAKKNNLPFLQHVTLPRIGATKVILNALVAQQENGSPAGGDARKLGMMVFSTVFPLLELKDFLEYQKITLLFCMFIIFVK